MGTNISFIDENADAANDQRGIVRPASAGIDIGAYQTHSSVAPAKLAFHIQPGNVVAGVAINAAGNQGVVVWTENAKGQQIASDNGSTVTIARCWTPTATPKAP